MHFPKELLFSSIYSLPDIPVSVRDSLKSLQAESEAIISAVRQNLEIFTQRTRWLYLTYQDLDQDRNKKELEILDSFKHVLESAEELESYLIERENRHEEMLLFQNAFMEKNINFLTKIMEFEQYLNSKIPDLSDRVVNIVGNLLIALLAAYSPLSAIVVKSSGIVESIRSTVHEKNISTQIEKWQEKVKYVQEKLQEITIQRSSRDRQKLELISAIAASTEVSPVLIAALGLSNKNLEEINKDIASKAQYKAEVKNLVELSRGVQSSSHNMSLAAHIVTSIKAGMLQHLENLPVQSKKGTLQDIIEKGLTDVQAHMVGAISPDKGVIEKLDLCYKAVSTIHRTTKQINQEAGPEVGQAFTKLVQVHMQHVIPKKFLDEISSPTIPLFKDMLGTSKVVQILFEQKGVGKGLTISI